MSTGDHVVKRVSHRHHRQGQGGAYETHKDRSIWFLQRAAFPLRDAPPLALEHFWSHQEDYPHVHDLHWEEAGPTNYAGRVTCLVVDPNDPQTIFAGSAAGGVWKTTNGGAMWHCTWPCLLNQNIGALAIHHMDGRRLICATGEGNLSGESYPGSGIYETQDGGLTWTAYFTAPGGGRLKEEADAQLPRRVGTIAFAHVGESDPGIALGAVSSDESLPAALYMDEGAEGLRPNLSWGVRSYNCYAIAFHPTTPGLMYVSIQPRGTQNGIWRSPDLGKTWKQVMNGMPAPEQCGRIGLALAPSNPSILYAQVSGLKGQVLGIYRSDNGGELWHSIGGDHFHGEGQMSYNNAIAVHPENPDHVVCGGVNLHMTVDGGKHWRQITTGQRGDAGDPFPKNFVHSDHHAILIRKDGVIYSGNDGGIAVSEDGGVTWNARHHGMVTAMFYAADVAQTNSSIFGGGTQDNGTLIAGVPDRPKGSIPKPKEFTRVLAGDGGWLEIDPADEEHVFGATANLILSRHNRGEPWAAGRQLAGWTDISISPNLITPAEMAERAFAVLEIEPGATRKKKRVWVGTNRLWVTEDDGKTWAPASNSFDDSAVSAIECAAADPQVMYVGTSVGGLYRTRDGGASWSANLAGAVIPRRVITRIATHPALASTLVITVASSGVPGTSLQLGSGSKGLPYAHVFGSSQSGDTWREIEAAGLPDVVYTALTFESQPPYRLFLGGDSGVWVMDPGSKRWVSIAGNMPAVVVSDLIYHQEDQLLTAATYGRGIWRLKVPEAFEVADAHDDRHSADSPCAAGLRRDPSVRGPVLLTPPDGAKLGSPAQPVTLTWKPVPGAIAYTVDVTSEHVVGYVQSYSSREPSVTFEFIQTKSATWQVWALLADSRRSAGSAKRTVHFHV